MNKRIENQATKFAKEHGRKRQWHKALTMLAAVVVFVTTYVLIMPAVTLQSETYCECEEHEHTDKCYTEVRTLTCQLTEQGHTHTDDCYEEKAVLTCGLEETDGHTHSDGCYAERQSLVCTEAEGEDHAHSEGCYDTVRELVCGLEECAPHHHDEGCYSVQKVAVCHLVEHGPHQHTDECYSMVVDTEHPACGELEHKHTLRCYSDPEADVETAAVWERTFAKVELTGNWRDDVLAIAESQLGYTESSKNYSVLDDGTTMMGYTRYGAWYGMPYEDWCAMYCSFCLNYAKVDSNLMPREANTERWAEKLKSRGMYGSADHEAEPGDLVFLDMNRNGEIDHVGFVYEVKENGDLRTIEGNSNDCVEYVTYDKGDERVMGYGLLPENPKTAAKAIGKTDKIEEKTAPLTMTLMAAGDPVTTTPLDVEDYVNAGDVTVEYRENGDTTESGWKNVASAPDTGIPGDADMRLNVTFEDVDLEDLVNAGYQMTFTIPAIMRNPEVESHLMAGAVEAGNISVEGDVVTLDFDPEWVTAQQKYDNEGNPETTLIDGDFWVYSDIDLTEAAKEKPYELIVGEAAIYLYFEDNIVEKNGDVSIVKSEATMAKDDDGHYYLTYTLTVTAGSDGCPDVSVKDNFAPNDYTQNYTLVSYEGERCYVDMVDIPETDEEGNPKTDDAGEPVTKNMPQLTWEVGDMAANDTKTLTYKVRLDDSYIGGATKDTVENSATVFSGDFERERDVIDFQPKGEISISKIKSSLSTSVDETKDGCYVYRIAVTAPADNSYPLENVIITDALNGTIGGVAATSTDFLPYLEYDCTVDPNQSTANWWLENGTSNNKKNYIRNVLDDVDFFNDTNNDGKRNEGFSVNIGTIQPGQTISLRYFVTVDPGIIPAMGGSDAKINNGVGVILDNDGEVDKTDTGNVTITHREWARKTYGDRVESPLTFPIPSTDSVYDVTGGSVQPSERPASGSFTVPTGSYKYQIVANEAGKWDISSASMTDAFVQAWMEYQGYVRVDAYEISTAVTGADDQEVIANLSAKPIAKTVWVKVDKLSTFKFKPEDIGLSDNYAYLVTYYAKPETNEMMIDPVAVNNFGVEGEVGVNGKTYYLTGVNEAVSVTVETDTSFRAQKEPWYYANIVEEPLDNYPKGALYWVVEADGAITAGTRMRDHTTSSNSYFRSDSIVGVYKGPLGDGMITSHSDLAEFENDSRFTQIDPADYGITFEYYSSTLKTQYDVSQLDNKSAQYCFIIFTENIPLAPNEALYFVLRTHPSTLPTKTTSYSYKNGLSSGLVGSEVWSTEQTVTLKGSTNEFLYKYSFVGEYDGTTMTNSSAASLTGCYVPKISSEVANAAVVDGGSMKPGTYVNWAFKLNSFDNMSGRYRVLDHVPEGLQPEFLYPFYRTINLENHIEFVDIPANELPEGNWTRHETTMDGYYSSISPSNKKPYTAIWYTDDDNNVLFDVDGFYTPYNSAYGLQLILGTRVVDENVLMYGQLGEYQNTAELQNSEHKPIDRSTATQTIQKKTLSKDDDWTPGKANKYPFYIEINPLGEDLMPTSNRVKVNDTLSDNLSLDPDSIRVKNTLTGEPVTGYSTAVDGQTFSVTVPDNLPLTITYDTYVNALPGTPVDIENKAWWDGATEPEYEVVEVSEFSYNVGGSVTVETPPNIEIIKSDTDRVERKLADAYFTVQEMSVAADGTLSEKSGGLCLSGVTNADGKLTLQRDPNDTQKYLEVNTVYRIVETQAPFAYELDSTPRYFIIARKIEQENGDPDYPKELLNSLSKDLDDPNYVDVHYYELNPKYSVNIYDKAFYYELPMTGGTGTAPIYALGFALSAFALMCGFSMRRKRERRGAR